MEADATSNDTTTSTLKPSNAKPIVNNPYLRNPISLGYFSPYPPHVDTARLQSIARGSQNSFQNPYLSHSILSTRPSSRVRSLSDVQAPKPLANRSSGSATNAAHIPSATTTVFAVTSNETLPFPKLRSKPSRQTIAGSLPRASTPRPGNTAMADRVMIPKHVALKMNYDDFKPEEFLDRSEWADLARYPGNLDPPNGMLTLRCLFCEKKYSGPNARSMWRRHVGGKHSFLLNGGKAMPSKPARGDALIPFGHSSKKRDRKRPKKKPEIQPTSNSRRMEGSPEQESSVNNSFETIDVALSEQSDDEVDQALNETQDDGAGDLSDNGLALLESPIPRTVSDDLYDFSQDTIQALKDLPPNAPTTPFGPPSMRRALSTPSYPPSRDISGFNPLEHPFLLPPFEEGDSQNAKSTPSNLTSPVRPEWPSECAFSDSTNIPITEEPTDPKEVAEEIARRGLKATSSFRDHGLSPSIALALPLRSPRSGKSLRSPPTPSGSENQWLPSKPDSPGLNPSNRPSTPRSYQRNTDASPTSLLQRLTANRAGTVTEGSVGTPAPLQRQRWSESERRRWLLALESPGPGPPFGSSPVASSSVQNSRFSHPSGSSPQQPALGRKTASFLHRSTIGGSNDDASSSFQTSEEAAVSESGKVVTHFTRSTPRRYTLPSSIYGSSPMGPPSTTKTRYLHSRTPSLAHSLTRSSSIDDLGPDDPFGSESSFPYDFHSRLRERLREGKKDSGLMFSASPFLKRTRDADPTEDSTAAIASSLDLPNLDWMDRQDSTPVKKKARLSP